MASIDLEKVLDTAWADLAELKYVRWAQALAALDASAR